MDLIIERGLKLISGAGGNVVLVLVELIDVELVEVLVLLVEVVKETVVEVLIELLVEVLKD